MGQPVHNFQARRPLKRASLGTPNTNLANGTWQGKGASGPGNYVHTLQMAEVLAYVVKPAPGVRGQNWTGVDKSASA